MEAYSELGVAVGEATQFSDLLLALLWWEKLVSGVLKLIADTSRRIVKLVADIAGHALHMAYEG